MAMPEMTPPASPSPAAAGGQPAPEGAPAGQDMKPMLLKVLLKVKQTAEGAGLDFAQLVAEASGGEAGMPSEGAAPRSPSPAAMMPPAGM
jgi:hypothetical protein